jgi:hypothetical protein
MMMYASVVVYNYGQAVAGRRVAVHLPKVGLGHPPGQAERVVAVAVAAAALAVGGGTVGKGGNVGGDADAPTTVGPVHEVVPVVSTVATADPYTRRRIRRLAIAPTGVVDDKSLRRVPVPQLTIAAV